jgi:hypothetical protein
MTTTPPPDPSLESSRIRRLTATARPLPIQGDLADYQLAELLQFLSQARRTGHLALERGDPPQAAAIHVEAGRIVDARCPPLRGDDAVISLVGWRQGRFLFVAGPAGTQRTVRSELPTLLLEGMRRCDELRTALSDLPSDTVVLHPVHDADLHDRRLTRLGWLVLARIDGTRSVGEVVESFGRGQVQVARTLVELFQAGLATITPETGFLDHITVCRTGSATIEDADAAALRAAADGRATLRDLGEELGLSPAVLVAIVGELLETGDLVINTGADAWRRHGDPLGGILDDN